MHRNSRYGVILELLGTEDDSTSIVRNVESFSP